jgi:hypothetical protein
MQVNVFVDESGNTGQALVQKGKPIFGDQPFFCLVGVILPNNSKEIQDDIKKISKKYNINLNELKASRIPAKKQQFFVDYFELLESYNIPVFIELMDKKYYVALNILDSLIIPTSELPKGSERDAILFSAKRNLVNRLYQILSRSTYEEFSSLCIDVNEKNFNSTLSSIANDIVSKRNPELDTLLMHLMKTHNSIKSIYTNSPNEDNLIQNYLPLPDKGTKSGLYLMPHVSCLLNLIPRFQYYANLKSASSISIIHDEQAYYDDTLKNTLKEICEQTEKGKDTLKIVSEAILLSKNMDGYEMGFNQPNLAFNTDANNIAITFHSSNHNIEIQMADLVAGFMTKSWKWYKKEGKLPEHAIVPYQYIFRLWEKIPATGCNMVVPDIDYDRILNQITDIK